MVLITFERTHNYALVRTVMTHPRIWPHISDDGSPAASDYRAPEGEHIWYVLARDAGELLGLWVFHPQNAVCWEVHTCVLPRAWGDVGLEAARLLPAWMWEHTPCRRIVTNIPATNRLALHFAINAGMHSFGVNSASYLKDGQLWDQVCLGISPPEIQAETLARREAETGSGAIVAGGLDVAAHAPASPGERDTGAEMRQRRSSDRYALDHVLEQ